MKQPQDWVIVASFAGVVLFLASCAPQANNVGADTRANVEPTQTTDPAFFTRIYEVSPSLPEGRRRLLASNFHEVDDEGSILIQFDEFSMEGADQVLQEPAPEDADSQADADTEESAAAEGSVQNDATNTVEAPNNVGEEASQQGGNANPQAFVYVPNVEVTVEVLGIINGDPTRLDIVPLRSQQSEDEGDGTSSEAATTPAEGESTPVTQGNVEDGTALDTVAPQNAFQRAAKDEINLLRRILLSGEIVPAPYIPQEKDRRVVPDQRADLNVLNARDYERIKIRVTNIRTNEVYETDLIPKPFGSRIKLGASLMFVNRMGVEPGTEINDTAITDVNFAAAPGVTISTIFYSRPEWLFSPVVRTLHPGIGFNVSYLSWNDGGTARDFELGLGVQASLFNDAVYGTYGFNLQAPAFNAYTGIGLNFVNLIELFN